jgi:glycogen operon protein
VAEGGTGGHPADPSGPLPGTPFPLGATAGRGGTNFAVASGVADRVDLCLFDETGAEDRVSLRDFDAGVWHGFVPGIGVGQRYGYRIAGPYDPARGLRCNPAKLLLDPYAKALAGTVTPGPEIEGYAAPDSDAPSAADSAAKMPRSLVISEEFAWTDDDRPARRYEDTIIYEAHVKGLTMRHPDVPPPLRGSYAGLAHEAVIGHVLGLGVTTVELLPVHESVPESFLVERGLTNYWGHNTIGYFAPHQAYSAAVRAGQPGGQVAEFKAMVNALHRAGLGSPRCRRSLTWWRRIRWCPESSWSPSRGTWARLTVTTWAGSRRCGGSGTAGTGTACGTSGAATRSACRSSRPGSAGPLTCTRARAGGPRRR